jgi:ribosomal-protein-serine acetyltransferase
MDLPETIGAGRLVLKRWEPAYAEDATRAVRESLRELKPFMPWAHDGYGVADSRSFIELSARQWAEGTAFNYAVLTAAGQVVGSCGLMTRMGEGTLEIGYWIHSGHTGRGCATAAVTALTSVALALPGVERVAIRHDAANPASGAVAAKAGFSEVERLHREPEAPGETGVDVVWERRRPAVTPVAANRATAPAR